jgi:RNA methyltransferase, TrmH family
VLLRELTGEPGRKRRGLFFAEGEELVRRAFEFGAGVRAVVLTERFAEAPAGGRLVAVAESAAAEVYAVTEGLLSKVLEAKPTPECLAILERKVCSLPDVLAGEKPLVQMVEHGENADNLGMLLRSCDAAGATGVMLTADTTDPFSRRVVRGSRGAVFTLPICIQKDLAKALQTARERGVRIIASSAQAEKPFTDADYTKPTMIVVGNEHVGISDMVRELADEVVRISMLGRINSLNIAVAASVLLYEAVRQRSA